MPTGKPIMVMTDGVYDCLACVFEAYCRPDAVKHLVDDHGVKEWLIDPDGNIWGDSDIVSRFRQLGAV